MVKFLKSKKKTDSLKQQSTFKKNLSSNNASYPNSIICNNSTMNSTIISLDKSCSLSFLLSDSSKSINSNQQTSDMDEKKINDRIIMTSLTTTVRVKTTTLIYYKPLKM